MTITSHRGAGGNFPENSLPAIREALRLNIPRIEIDIHQTSDNVLLVMHDRTLNRTTTGKGSIAKQSWQQISQHKLLDGGQAIPTLEQVLTLVQGRAQLVIEVKQGWKPYPQIEERVVDLIRKHQAEQWCIIQSFNTATLQRIHHLHPSLALHQLLWWRSFFTPAKTPYLQEISAWHRCLTPAWISQVHHQGLRINAWTVNSPSLIHKYRQWGVDGIITDKPASILTLL